MWSNLGNGVAQRPLLELGVVAIEKWAFGSHSTELINQQWLMYHKTKLYAFVFVFSMLVNHGYINANIDPW